MFKLIRRNLLRNKRRTILTVLSIAIALILLSFLDLLLAAMSGVNSANASRLVVRHAISLTFSLPAAYEQRLASLEHVEAITIMNWFQGRYIDDRPENFFPRFGTDPDTFPDVYPELEFSPEAIAAWRAERTAFIAGRALAEEKGWEPGDVITIEGDIYAVDIELTLRGFFTHPTDEAAERVLYFDWQYVEEALGNPGQINSFYVLLDSPDNMNETITQAEAMFENSPDQVRAETEAAFFLSFLEMMGNIQFLFTAIGLAVIASIFFITVNTMAMAARERTTEVAVLRTLGFTRSSVLAIVLFESLSVGVLGAAIGLAFMLLVSGALSSALASQGITFSELQLGGRTPILVMGIGVSLGLAAGLVPAVQAMNMKIVDGLRRVA